MLGRVYEYFLGKFATAEGKLGGEFYTPRPVVRLMVEMLEPFDGRVLDPACGSGGMFVQAEEFVEAHCGQRNDIAVFGQEKNPRRGSGRLSMTCHSTLQPRTLVTYLYYKSRCSAPTTPATGGEVAEAKMARAERSERTAAHAPRRSGPR